MNEGANGKGGECWFGKGAKDEKLLLISEFSTWFDDQGFQEDTGHLFNIPQVREDEIRRIEGSGGFIKSRRVLGRLAVSRAFGDIEYKNVGTGKPPLVTADPEIRIEKLTPADEFLLLACDGLFDVFTSQEAVNFVRRRLATMPPGEQVYWKDTI